MVGSDDPRQTAVAIADRSGEVEIDQGLRAYMLRIYLKVALGLVLSAALAYVTSSIPAVRDLLFDTAGAEAGALVGITPLGAIVALAPLVMLLSFETPAGAGAARRTRVLYWSIVACMGASQGILVLAFTGVSIATTLLITATAFGGLSLLGYVTRRDLSALASFLSVGLIGLLLALGVNLLLRSPAVAYISAMAGVLIFAGLIAYDTQRLKLAYRALSDEADLGPATDLGALSLYINFVNLFQFLLMLLAGERR